MKCGPPIPKHYILPVQHALQGYPKSPRIWMTMINTILTTNGFVSTTNEPCLYNVTINGHKVYFLRQVDNFAVSSPNKEITDNIFAMIQAS